MGIFLPSALWLETLEALCNDMFLYHRIKMNASGGYIGEINPLDIQDSFPYRHSAEERLLVNPNSLNWKGGT
jgi:hypothetical protein